MAGLVWVLCSSLESDTGFDDLGCCALEVIVHATVLVALPLK